MSWLLENHLLPDDEVDPKELLLAALESVSLSCTGDPEDDDEVRPLLVAIADAVPTDVLMDVLWHVAEPWAAEVLVTIDRVHPDKRVAKAARKALMQHRTNLAQRRRGR